MSPLQDSFLRRGLELSHQPPCWAPLGPSPLLDLCSLSRLLNACTPPLGRDRALDTTSRQGLKQTRSQWGLPLAGVKPVVILWCLNRVLHHLDRWRHDGNAPKSIKEYWLLCHGFVNELDLRSPRQFSAPSGPSGPDVAWRLACGRLCPRTALLAPPRSSALVAPVLVSRRVSMNATCGTSTLLCTFRNIGICCCVTTGTSIT